MTRGINEGKVKPRSDRNSENTTPTRFEDFVDELAQAYEAMLGELRHTTLEKTMDPRAIFGVSTLGSLVSSAVIAKLFAWPWLRALDRNESLIRLVAPHMFLRFILLQN
jgi:hypothetical protein